jgi:hypothetical protein
MPMFALAIWRSLVLLMLVYRHQFVCLFALSCDIVHTVCGTWLDWFLKSLSSDPPFIYNNMHSGFGLHVIYLANIVI